LRPSDGWIALFVDAVPTLPAGAWAVLDVKAYVPSHYAACIDTTPPKDSPQVLSMLPARAAELLRDKPHTASGIAPPPAHGPLPQPGLTKIWFEPYFPDGRLTFSGGFG
jgi:hypothetical protein